MELKVSNNYILRSIDDIPFGKLKELDQIIKLNNREVGHSDKTYDNITLMFVRRIVLGCIYEIDGLDTEAYVYADSYTDYYDEDKGEDNEIDDEVKEHMEDEYPYECGYSGKTFDKSYILLDEKTNLHVGCNDVYFDQVLESDKDTVCMDIRKKFKFSKNNKFYHGYVSNINNNCITVTRYICYKFNDNYVCIELSDSINHDLFNWSKSNEITLYDSSLKKSYKVKCKIEIMMDAFKKLSQIYNIESEFKCMERIYNLYSRDMVNIIKNEMVEDFKEYIFNGYYNRFSGIFTEENFYDFFTPLYENDTIKYKSYKHSFRSNFSKLDIYSETGIKDLNDEQKDLIKLYDRISDAIIKSKTRSAFVDAYTGEKIPHNYGAKYDIIYKDCEGLILKNSNVYINENYNSYIKTSEQQKYSDKTLLVYRVVDGIYIPIDILYISEEEKELAKILFERYDMVNKLIG